MVEAKRTRSKNYTEYEKTLLKQIVGNHAVIESSGVLGFAVNSMQMKM